MDTNGNSMRDIAAVVFDYGAVLAHPPRDCDLRVFSVLAGIPEARFRRLYASNRGPYDRGVLTPAEYWRGFGESDGLDYDDSQLRALAAMDMRLWSRLDRRMIELAAQLQRAGVKTAILSNMQSDLREVLREKAEWLSHFDVHVFSCDIKLIKPEPEIYAHLLGELGVEARRVYFIDDMPANIEAAQRAGIRGMVYGGFEELRERLEPLLAERTGAAGWMSQEVAVVQPAAHCD